MKLMGSNSDKSIERIIYLMQTDDSVDAPQDAIRRSKNIFRTRAPKPTLVEKVLAVLQIDLAPNKAVFGERSASVSQARQMLFEAGENALDLRITETERGMKIRGQILGGGFESALIKIGDHQTRSNEMSEFKFEELPKGVYKMILRSGVREILIEDIDLN